MKDQENITYKLLKLCNVPQWYHCLFYFSLQDFLVRFMDYFEGEQQSVILTEYLGGGELFEHISSTNYELTKSKCWYFVRQIFRAIEFIHSHRIIQIHKLVNNRTKSIESDPTCIKLLCRVKITIFHLPINTIGLSWVELICQSNLEWLNLSFESYTIICKNKSHQLLQYSILRNQWDWLLIHKHNKYPV